MLTSNDDDDNLDDVDSILADPDAAKANNIGIYRLKQYFDPPYEFDSNEVEDTSSSSNSSNVSLIALNMHTTYRTRTRAGRTGSGSASGSSKASRASARIMGWCNSHQNYK